MVGVFFKENALVEFLMVVLGFFNNISVKIESKLTEYIPLNNTISYIVVLLYFLLTTPLSELALYSTNTLIIYLIVAISLYTYKIHYRKILQNNHNPQKLIHLYSASISLILQTILQIHTFNLLVLLYLLLGIAILLYDNNINMFLSLQKSTFEEKLFD